MPKLLLLLRISFLTSIITLVAPLAPRSQTKYEQNRQCQIATEIVLPKINSLLIANNYVEMEQVLQDIEKNCGPNEVTQRIRIIGQLIQREQTNTLIEQYIQSGNDDQLIFRLDNAAQPDYKKIYEKDKATYHYVPLKHSVDSLIQIKAAAILASDSYNLNKTEEAIAYLFSDHVNTYLTLTERTGNEPEKVTKYDVDAYKYGWGMTLNAGLYRPISATNPIFNNQAIFSVAAISPLSHDWIYEFYLKIRSNKGSRPFEYNLYDTPTYVESPLNYTLGVTAGRKLLDNGKFMLIGKGGLGFESIVTGLTEVYDWFDTVEGVDRSSIDFNNVDTFNLSAGLSAMQHLYRRTFVGAQIQYHYAPHNIDSRLITPIASNYVSFELFFRF